MILTKREKQILKEHYKRGFLVLSDFNNYFANEYTIREKIRRLLIVGALQEGEYFKLMINKKKVKLDDID